MYSQFITTSELTDPRKIPYYSTAEQTGNPPGSFSEPLVVLQLYCGTVVVSCFLLFYSCARFPKNFGLI